MKRPSPIVALTLSALLLLAVLAAAPVLSRSSLPLGEVLELNLPRTVVAAVVGAALAVAGVVLQSVLRNPLATPFTLGISSGAALGAAAAIKLQASAAALALLPVVELGSLAGGLASATLVYAIARSRAELPAETLLLAGVAVAQLSASGIAVLQFLSDTPDLAAIVRWNMGGIGGIGWTSLGRVVPLLLAGGAAFALLGRDLDVASLDEESARALGVDPVRARKLAFLGSSLVTSAVVAIAGPVGFVGLVVPHAVRRLVGNDHRVVLPCSALGGAALLVACDAAARTVLYPTELPINVVTSVIGCPTFVWILARSRAGR